MARRRTKRNSNLRDIIFGDESLFDVSQELAECIPKTTVDSKTQSESQNLREQKRIFTVSELTLMIRTALELNLPERLLVTGEISNLSQPSSGHIYFTLKDEYAQINCVVWRSISSKIKFSLENGIAVIAGGNIDIYAPRGQYQLYVDMLKPAGVGELELAFRQLKEKLEKQGLFDSSHKLPLPKYPFTIAIVTSLTGAAIRDIIRTLNLRWPIGRVLIYPVQVQGEQAKFEIAQAIKDVNLNADKLNIDLIILARGGGSLEDLWAFNEEIVARAIYESQLPIITGIGHEIDVTIADLVADLRSATPTAAAQLATPKLEDVLTQLNKYLMRMDNVVSQQIWTNKRHLRTLANRGIFRNPKMILAYYIQKLDETTQSLQKFIALSVTRARATLHSNELNLNKISPRILFTRSKYKLENLKDKLSSAMQSRYKTDTLNIEHLQKRLDNCDYRRVLKRGFAIVKKAENNKLITSVKQTKINERILTELSDGLITSKIIRKNDADK